MDNLTIDLFGRGMGPLHRAGLGGLACTLARLDWPDSEWSIDDEGRRLTLRWPGGAEGAKPFFQKLYAMAFDLDDGMIHLPGAYGEAASPVDQGRTPARDVADRSSSSAQPQGPKKKASKW